MTNKNIFNAIRSVDEELILGASTSEKAPGAKRKILLKALTSAAAVILVISLSVGGAMMMRDANKFPEDKPQEAPQDPPKQPDVPTRPESSGSHMFSLNFSNIDDFKAHMNDEEERDAHYQVDEDAYIDFDSIIPNSQIYMLGITGKNRYQILYTNTDGTYYTFTVHVEKTDYVPPSYIKSVCSMDELKKFSFQPSDTWVKLEIGNETFLYGGGSRLSGMDLFIDGYRVWISWNECDIDKCPTIQYEFLSTIVPAYGATDDSLMETFNKIKALIPESDEANHSQEKEDADTTDTASTNDGIVTDTPVSEPAYEEETSNETYEEEEEYLYPEDYEFPVIPGISPDWKPNRNGKYPLKDGYTREEMTLIVACAIELDFGDMTDEEISKIDFIIIDDEEETEDNTEQ